MRRFVQPRRRTGSRRIIVRTESKKNSGWKLFLYYHRQKIVGALVVISTIYFLFFYNWNPIQRVTFSQETYQTLEYNTLLDTIGSGLVGKGYFSEKYSKWGEFTNSIRKEFPIVKSLRTVAFDKGTLTIDIQYNKPDFIAQTIDNNLRYVYHNNFIPYISGSTLSQSGFVINMTLSAETVENLSGGVFWKIGSQDLVKIINQITFLPKTGMQFTYYPGWEKMKVISTNGTFLLSLDPKILPKIFEKWQNIIPYMPISEPYSVDLSDPDRIIIKQ